MNIRHLAITGLLALAAASAYAADCEIGMGIAPITEGDNVDAKVARQLEAKLKSALTYNGVAAGDYDCQFFIAGRFDHSYSEQAGGVGGRVLVKTDLQLAICDGEGQKVYATTSIPLKGVGATDQQALVRAMSSLNARNPEFARFVENGKAKIVDYFNKNYSTYITKANRSLKARDYDEALYWASSIPECCNGYSEAHALVLSIYNDKINYDAAMLLAQAEGAWAADPTSDGAAAAYAYLAQIDPSASCYDKAKTLGKKIGATVKEDYDFETKEKYRDAVALEKMRINSAREVAIAWAKSRPRTIVRHHWWW